MVKANSLRISLTTDNLMKQLEAPPITDNNPDAGLALGARPTPFKISIIMPALNEEKTFPPPFWMPSIF